MPLPPAGGGSLNNLDLKQKVTTNVEHVIGRINGIAPQYISEEVNALGWCDSVAFYTSYKFFRNLHLRDN